MKSKRTNILLTVTAALTALSEKFSFTGLESAKQANAEYMKSGRGKGRGGGLSAHRIFSKTTNSRKPHQGAKECARRRGSSMLIYR